MEITVEKIKNKVVALREENLYHDSYFYATFWDEETQTFVEYEYGATAYAGGLPGGKIDAPEELIQKYYQHVSVIKEKNRIAEKNFFPGEVVKIVSGRKMLGEVKKISSKYRFHVQGTYGKKYTDYFVFEDGTKVNVAHCILEDK